MSGLAGPRNCTRPGPFEASFPLPSPYPSVYPPQQFLVPLAPCASCPSVHPSVPLRPSVDRFRRTPIIPNSSVCFVLPCYYAVLAPAYAGSVHDPPRKRQKPPLTSKMDLRDTRSRFEDRIWPNLPRAWLSPLSNALTFTPWCVVCYTCLGKWSMGQASSASNDSIQKWKMTEELNFELVSWD